MEKLIRAITVKLSDDLFRFADTRCQQLGMESAPEYMRYLLETDKAKAEHDYSLLGFALGKKDFPGDMDSEGNEA